MGTVKKITIEKLDKEIAVYDITVDKYHNFAIGNNKNIVHNCEYLHGDISGSIVSLAKNYVGSNNIPLLRREGNFGTRFEPEASANRYILTAKEPIFNKLFKEVDNNILINQDFEGTNIEPRFYVPTLPLILVNGSEGIATGFAQKILPRDVETLEKYIKAYIINKKTPELKPYYNGFKGIIEKTEIPNQWLIKGTFERKSIIKIVITELPIGYNLNSYIKVLNTLEDKKVIRNFKDLSEEDEFKFEVQMDSKSLKASDDVILDKLKLIKKVTENFTVLDENNTVIQYNSPEEVINHYIRIKLEYLNKRKSFQITDIQRQIDVITSKYNFVKKVTDEDIIVNKTKKVDIIKQIETFKEIIKIDDSHNYLLRMPIYDLTLERLQELKNDVDAKVKELEYVKNKEITETWLDELKELK